jgi:type I restriction enzyme M protein
MANESSTIIQKLWNFCNVLRDDGVGYNDYVEQLTYLLFLKMIDEQAQLPPPFGKPSTIPEEHNWQSLRSKSGDDLEIHYRKTLERLAKEKGLLGVIFRKSQNKIQDPAKLERLIALINDETWFSLDVDVKGAIYEGLLQKNAEDIKNGAGQYFTPRPLIKTIVEVMQPKPGERICDPACGTGGFFLVAYDYLKQHYKLDKAQLQFLRYMTFKGYDVADSVVRLCAMNLYLHGLSGDESPILSKDSLSFTDSNNYEMVLTNPPFGKKSSITITGKDDDNKKENGTKESKKKITHQRDGFYTTTSNKQLNFLRN